MTIGALSRRTGVAVKTLREYEDMGLIYTVGRTPENYRLFDDDALWCVGVVGNLRGLGLTLAEIQGLAGMYLRPGDEPVGPRMESAFEPCARGSKSGSPKVYGLAVRPISDHPHAVRIRPDGP